MSDERVCFVGAVSESLSPKAYMVDVQGVCARREGGWEQVEDGSPSRRRACWAAPLLSCPGTDLHGGGLLSAPDRSIRRAPRGSALARKQVPWGRSLEWGFIFSPPQRCQVTVNPIEKVEVLLVCSWAPTLAELCSATAQDKESTKTEAASLQNIAHRLWYLCITVASSHSGQRDAFMHTTSKT